MKQVSSPNPEDCWIHPEIEHDVKILPIYFKKKYIVRKEHKVKKT